MGLEGFLDKVEDRKSAEASLAGKAAKYSRINALSSINSVLISYNFSLRKKSLEQTGKSGVHVLSLIINGWQKSAHKYSTDPSYESVLKLFADEASHVDELLSFAGNDNCEIFCVYKFRQENQAVFLYDRETGRLEKVETPSSVKK